MPVEKLLPQLASKDPKTRDAARRRLEQLGPDALPALRAALAHPDLEVRKRVSEVIPSIETAELVKPKLITLRAEKKTARQLLDEIGKQTGYKMDLWNDDPNQVYTVDLNQVTFWKAIDEVSRLSGLAPMIGYGDERLRFQKESGFPAHVAYDGVFRLVPTNFEYHRSLSFRKQGEQGRPIARAETLTLNYTLHSEPKLPILSLGEAMVQAAEDEEGRSLMPLPNFGGPSEERGGGVQRRVSRYGNGYASLSMQGSVTLGRPAEKARGVRHLQMMIPVTLLAEQKPEVVTEGIVDIKKKKVKVGTTTFEIDSCTKSQNGQYQLKMTVNEDSIGPDDYTWMNSLYRRVELVDEKGNKYSNHGSSWSHSTPNLVQVTFNYGQSGGTTLGPPTRLIYHTWKTMTYQVRVDLRELPLP